MSAVANSETAATKAANYFLVECNEYDEELRLNEINNLDALLTETQNKLSTSVDKDGYWCFKRKEGCKYLAVSSYTSLLYNYNPVKLKNKNVSIFILISFKVI